MAIRPNNNVFKTIVRNTPLVSIDLIIKNSNGDYLLNLRGRSPAYHKWFFLGGSIKKPEKPEEAFNRIIDREFFSTLKINFKDAKFTKLAVHRYKENLDGQVNTFEEGIQYYVLCYELLAELSPDFINTLTQKYTESSKRKIENVKRKKNDENGSSKESIEPESVGIAWFSQEQIKAEKEVHPYVVDYFTNNPEIIISSSQTNIEPKELLMLYQTQSKSLNNYTNVIWAFPIAFVLALGTIYKYFNDNIIAMLTSIAFGAVLLHAFFKHTYIHELLVKSVNEIERNIRAIYSLDSAIIPNWSLIRKPYTSPSHILVRRFLFIFTIIYSAFALIKSLIIYAHWLCNLID
jgi:colanic acid biosynthesis protein WcaH